MSIKETKWSIKHRIEEQVKIPEDALILKPPFPNNIRIELTNSCNHACIFCANAKMSRKKKLIDKRLLLSILKQARDLGTEEVGFYMTGEPFMHKELQFYVLEAKKMGYEYTYISTNGALASPEKSKLLIDSGIDSIKFSINAATRETYRLIHGRDDWERVIENIRFISEYRKKLDRPLRLAITFVVIDLNRKETKLFESLLGGLVDDICFFQCDNGQGYMPENIELVERKVQLSSTKNPCYQLFKTVLVTCEGYLTLCCNDFQNYLAVADLNNIGLLDAWWSQKFIEMRKRHLNSGLKGTLCWNCINCKQDPVEPLVKEYATNISRRDLRR
jgi:organic radical activating enzyme